MKLIISCDELEFKMIVSPFIQSNIKAFSGIRRYNSIFFAQRKIIIISILQQQGNSKIRTELLYRLLKQTSYMNHFGSRRSFSRDISQLEEAGIIKRTREFKKKIGSISIIELLPLGMEIKT